MHRAGPGPDRHGTELPGAPFVSLVDPSGSDVRLHLRKLIALYAALPLHLRPSRDGRRPPHCSSSSGRPCSTSAPAPPRVESVMQAQASIADLVAESAAHGLTSYRRWEDEGRLASHRQRTLARATRRRAAAPGTRNSPSSRGRTPSAASTCSIAPGVKVATSRVEAEETFLRSTIPRTTSRRSCAASVRCCASVQTVPLPRREPLRRRGGALGRRRDRREHVSRTRCRPCSRRRFAGAHARDAPLGAGSALRAHRSRRGLGARGARVHGRGLDRTRRAPSHPESSGSREWGRGAGAVYEVARTVRTGPARAS